MSQHITQVSTVSAMQPTNYAFVSALVVFSFALLLVGLSQRPALGSAALGSSAVIRPAAPRDGTESMPPNTEIETLLTGMNLPAAMAFDLSGRLFYTEKDSGLVRLFENGVLQPSPVITF